MLCLHLPKDGQHPVASGHLGTGLHEWSRGDSSAGHGPRLFETRREASPSYYGRLAPSSALLCLEEGAGCLV